MLSASSISTVAHLLALGPGLRRHQLHTQDGGGDLLGLRRRGRQLDAAALAATAGVNLRLDDAATTELLTDLELPPPPRSADLAARRRRTP